MWKHPDLLIIMCTALSCVTGAAHVINEFGYEGRGVSILCSYDSDYKSNEKYLCKNNCGDNDDDVLIKTSQKNQSKYFIHDDKMKSFFTATISDLQLDDAGKYWCGIKRSWKKDIYTEINLTVKPDSCCDKVTKIQSDEGASVSITCPYDSKDLSNNLKIICRGKRPSTCLQQALITSNKKQNGRFRLTEDKESGIFTVTISSLTLKDSGSYLCGVQSNAGPDVLSAVELEVKAAPQQTSTVTPIPTSELVTSLSSSPHDSGKPTSGSLLHVLFAVPAVVLLILAFALVKGLKSRRDKVKDQEVTTDGNKLEAAHRQEVTGAAAVRKLKVQRFNNKHCEVYENHDALVMQSQQETSKQQSAGYNSEGEDEEPEYENITAEELYCNEFFYKTHRK